MTEPQRVTIYSAAYDRSPGASHRLLRQAAQLYAPGLAEPALASGAHGSRIFRTRRSCSSAFPQRGILAVRVFRRAGRPSTCSSTAIAKSSACAPLFFLRQSRLFWNGLPMRPFLTSGAQRRAISNSPARAFPPWRQSAPSRLRAASPSVPGVNLQLLPLFAGYSACLCTASPGGDTRAVPVGADDSVRPLNAALFLRNPRRIRMHILA